MTTYVVLLRAINVGGHNKIRMAELRDLLEEQSFTTVATYIQSGNVVCSSSKTPAWVTSTIKQGIRQRFGHDIDVIVRTADDIASIIKRFPYADANPKASGVMFMNGKVSGDLDVAKFAPDELEIVGPDIFVKYAESFSSSKLTPAWIEKQTGRAGTRRNWTTVLKLHDMIAR